MNTLKERKKNEEDNLLNYVYMIYLQVRCYFLYVVKIYDKSHSIGKTWREIHIGKLVILN